jgi:hypothetical protein
MSKPHGGKLKWSVTVAALLLLLGLAAAAAWWVPRLRQEPAREKQTRENLHRLQVAMERYAVDDPFYGYPLSFETLLAKDGPAVVPTNPYTGRPMQEIKAGDPPRPGDFSYLVQPTTLMPGYQLGDKYSLVAYRGLPGPRKIPLTFAPGMERLDWHWVLVTFSSGEGMIRKKNLRYERLHLYMQQHPDQPPPPSPAGP